MRIVESIFRRIGYSFSIASFVTLGYTQMKWTYFHIPLITWILTAVLFLLSWRVVAEYKRIIIHFDGSLEPSETSLFGKLKKERPRLYHISWGFIYTLGAWAGPFIALESFSILHPIEQNTLFYILLFASVPMFFRFCDKTSYKE